MNAPGERTLKVGHGVFDPLRGELALEGRSVKLRPRTAVLLSYLVQHPGRVIGKDELMHAVWPDVVVTEDSLVQCVKEIRHALGDAGREWVRTMPRQGYAFAADSPAQAQRMPRVGRPWWRIAAFGLLGLTLAGAVGWRHWPGPAPAAVTAPPRSFVVLPIENHTGDPARERSTQEITEAVTAALGRGVLRVVAPSTASTYRGEQVDVRSLGAKLSVRYVVQGALRLEDDQPVLTLRMADASTGLQLWQQELSIAPGWSQQLREDLEGVTTAFINAMRSADARHAGNPDAIRSAELVSRARELMRGPPATTETERQLQLQTLLEEAMRLHDGSASAWAILAFTYLHEVRYSPDRSRKLQQATAAAERSLRIAPTSDGSHITRGWVYIEQGRPDLAVRMFDRAIELNPKNAWAFASRGNGLLYLGRPEDALVSLRQAIQLSPRDPKLPRWRTMQGIALLHLGRIAEAIEPLSEGAQSDSPHPTAHLYLASALALSGRIEEARASAARHLQRLPAVTAERWLASEPGSAPEVVQQRQRVYEGLRLAGLQG